MRHTFATWSLAAGMSIFTLARRMGTSVQMIDETYGHLARDTNEQDCEMLDAYDTANGRGHVVGPQDCENGEPGERGDVNNPTICRRFVGARPERFELPTFGSVDRNRGVLAWCLRRHSPANRPFRRWVRACDWREVMWGQFALCLHPAG